MQRFKKVLFVAEPEGADNAHALQRAIELAKSNQAALVVLGVVESAEGKLHTAITGLSASQAVEVLASECYARLEAMARDLAGEQAFSVRVAVGRPFLEVIRTVVSSDFDLVVKPAAPASPGFRRLAGTDMRLLRKCPCPVWIIESTEADRYKAVLAAIDVDAEEDGGDALSRQILEMASSLALTEFCPLHVVHAWSLPHEDYWRSPRSGLTTAEVDRLEQQARDGRERWMRRLLDETGRDRAEVADYLQPTLHIEKGLAQDVIPRLAESLGAEVIVMGTLGRSGVAGFFMGNTSEEVLKQISCSVLAIKPPGFVSPVLAG